MRVVIPVSHKDLELAVLMARRIQALGGCADSPCLVVSTKLAESGTPRLLNELRPSFANVELHVLPNENEMGWPRSCNHIFKGTIIRLMEMKNTLPWYFLEADNVPMKRGWLTQLTTEYNLAQKPFMGAVVPTHAIRNKVRIEWGQHMVGTGIYPADISKYTSLWKYLAGIQWDVFMQWEILPHCHATESIQHNWQSCDYRRTAEGIACSPVQDLSIANPVRPSALVVHGCKDTSLLDLLDKKTKPAVGGAVVPQRIPASPKPVEKAAPPPAGAPELVAALTDEQQAEVFRLADKEGQGVVGIAKATGFPRWLVKQTLTHRKEAAK